MKKRYILPLVAAMMLCLSGCADNDELSSSKSAKEKVTTIAATTESNSEATTFIVTTEPTEPSTEQQTGIIKHTDRPNEGLYLEDYIEVNFKGSEHDSEVEVIVDWKKLAKDIENDISPDLLEAVYRIKVLNTDERPIDHTIVDDLVNGDTVELCIYENTLDKDFKKEHTKELKYIEDNVWYYEKTTVIVSGLK